MFRVLVVVVEVSIPLNGQKDNGKGTLRSVYEKQDLDLVMPIRMEKGGGTEIIISEVESTGFGN